MKTRTQLVAGILAPLLVVAAEQTALSSWSDSEKERFLQTAKVVKTKDLSIGVTGTQRLTLSDGVSTHDAHFQNIDVSQMKFESPRGSEMNFRDSYKYNIAGYRLDRMLDLRMAPVSVERKIGGRTGAMTWWVDDVQMMESERLKKKIKAPDLDKWNDQMHQVNLFTELIYNTDQNMTNLLITNDWTLWMIDFSRAFRRYTTLRDAKRLGRVDRRVWLKLTSLSKEKLTDGTKPFLIGPEIDGVLARRDRIVEFFQKELARKGEAAVICGLPGH